jgi:hypothetical protein
MGNAIIFSGASQRNFRPDKHCTIVSLCYLQPSEKKGRGPILLGRIQLTLQSKHDQDPLDACEIVWNDAPLNSFLAVELQAISLWIKIPYTLFVFVLVPVYWIRYGLV